MRLNERKFAEWLVRFRTMVDELVKMEDPDGKWFYLTTLGLQIDEPLFGGENDCGCEDDGLERKAYRVLEDLLKHEREDIRLRAAEIIVGCRPGSKAQ